MLQIFPQTCEELPVYRRVYTVNTYLLSDGVEWVLDGAFFLLGFLLCKCVILILSNSSSKANRNSFLGKFGVLWTESISGGGNDPLDSLSFSCLFSSSFTNSEKTVVNAGEHSGKLSTSSSMASSKWPSLDIRDKCIYLTGTGSEWLWEGGVG